MITKTLIVRSETVKVWTSELSKAHRDSAALGIARAEVVPGQLVAVALPLKHFVFPFVITPEAIMAIRGTQHEIREIITTAINTMERMDVSMSVHGDRNDPTKPPIVKVGIYFFGDQMATPSCSIQIEVRNEEARILHIDKTWQ